MTGLRAWAVYGALLALAAATAIATRQSRSGESQVPSIDNPGPLGAKALKVYLEESGRTVLALREPLTALPPEVRSLVIAAPVARPFGEGEVAAVEAFVRGGGTVVYLAPRGGASQRQLAAWLELSGGSRLPAATFSTEALDDLGGATVLVSLPFGAADSVSRLRLSADTTLRAGDGAVPAAGPALWWKPLGQGELWLAAGADLVENRRLELEDNLRFWDNLASRAPIAFDEFHHHAGPAPPMSVAFAAFALQLLACTAALAWARGTRLGPARPELVQRHRGSLEYLHSLAHLTRRAGVERELAAELPARLRLLMQERLGIASALPEAEASVELERRCRIPAAQTQALLAQARALAGEEVSPKQYARLAREFARIERIITGRAPASAAA